MMIGGKRREKVKIQMKFILNTKFSENIETDTILYDLKPFKQHCIELREMLSEFKSIMDTYFTIISVVRPKRTKNKTSSLQCVLHHAELNLIGNG